MADDPNLHPQEVQYVEPVRHTVNLVSGEHTIEPLTDEQLQTAQITAFGPEDPRGNVHRAGSVVIETEPNRVVLESAIRRRDANLQDPAEAEAFDAAFAQVEEQRQADLAAARANVQDIRRQDQPGVAGFDYEAAFARADEQRQADLAIARANVLDVRRQDQPGGEGFDYEGAFARADEQRQAQTPPGDYPEPPRGRAEIERFNRDYRRVVGEEPTGNLRQDLRRYRIARSRSGSDGSGGDASLVQSPSGQGPARSGNRPRSANNSVDVGGLMQGGRNRPRGGGRRRRDDEDEDQNYRRPTIEIVLEG